MVLALEFGTTEEVVSGKRIRRPAGGLPEELSAVDQILHRGEANPRTRSGIMTLEILDTTPDWERVPGDFDNASRKVLRLRQKVVMPTLPTAAPRWVVDPDFNLDFHVRRVRVAEPGTLREVIDLAEVALQSPLDISRPLWTATLVEGLAGGRAAQLVHLSHAVTDGVGGVEMFANIYDLERDPPPQDAPPLPIPQDLSPNDLMRARHSTGLPGAIAGGVRDALFGAAHGGRERDPRPGVVGGQRRRLRHVECPGDRRRPPNRRRCCDAAACRRAARPSTSSSATCTGRPRRPAARSTTPTWPVCAARLRLYHEAMGVPDRHAADGGTGQPAIRRRSRRRKPVRRGQSRRADRPRRPREADQEHPLADDPQARRSAPSTWSA